MTTKKKVRESRSFHLATVLSETISGMWKHKQKQHQNKEARKATTTTTKKYQILFFSMGSERKEGKKEKLLRNTWLKCFSLSIIVISTLRCERRKRF
jgi:hypothetical protein